METSRLVASRLDSSVKTGCLGEAGSATKLESVKDGRSGRRQYTHEAESDGDS